MINHEEHTLEGVADDAIRAAQGRPQKRRAAEDARRVIKDDLRLLKNSTDFRTWKLQMEAKEPSRENKAYFDAVREHKRHMRPGGGLTKGSGMHDASIVDTRREQKARDAKLQRMTHAQKVARTAALERRRKEKDPDWVPPEPVRSVTDTVTRRREVVNGDTSVVRTNTQVSSASVQQGVRTAMRTVSNTSAVSSPAANNASDDEWLLDASSASSFQMPELSPNDLLALMGGSSNSGSVVSSQKNT